MVASGGWSCFLVNYHGGAKPYYYQVYFYAVTTRLSRATTAAHVKQYRTSGRMGTASRRSLGKQGHQIKVWLALNEGLLGHGLQPQQLHGSNALRIPSKRGHRQHLTTGTMSTQHQHVVRFVHNDDNTRQLRSNLKEHQNSYNP